MGVQADRKGPGCQVGLTPDIPDRSWIRTPFCPGRGLELKEADISGHLVVGPWVELALADGGIEKPVTRNTVSTGCIVDGRDDPLLPECLAGGNTEGSERPANQGAKQRTTLHENRST